MTPDAAFFGAPIAHRGLHDGSGLRPENSMPAVSAALERDYSIEIDVQCSSDGVAMAFHDDDLLRLTGQSGRTREKSSFELSQHRLLGGRATIPRLRDVLDRIAGRVPLLIEIKDQDGGLGDQLLQLEEAVARDLSSYRGLVAVMSFNPHSVAKMARLAARIPRGLVTESFPPQDWPGASGARLNALRAITDFDRVGASFISHEADDLGRDKVAVLKARGVPVLCWTVRSFKEEETARKIADNITFEGYLPQIPQS